MKRIVVALGGNALGNSWAEQYRLAKETAKVIVDLIEKGNEVIITHGNGPQIGMINLAFEKLSKSSNYDQMPFPECGAMSQGYIGYHLQNAIQTEFYMRNLNNKVATIITQVIVDKDDPAFLNPTKPIGSFYSIDKAKALEKENQYTMVEDSGRGYRRVIASPKPIGILEIDIIRSLVNANHTIITVGGGGIPVIKKENEYIGVSAVIDKDLASAKLAELINADMLIILTAVDKVSLNYGKSNQIDLDILSIKDVNKYIKEGHFAKGSMLPKVESASSFITSGEGKSAIIASLNKAVLALEGKSGTKIVR